MIEGSKSVAKEIMLAAGIPTAAARTCRTEAEVSDALDEFGPPYVVKADGLAAGKGVVVTNDRRAAAVHAESCGQVVIEDFLAGPEVSVFALADGTHGRPAAARAGFQAGGRRRHRAEHGRDGRLRPAAVGAPGLAARTVAEVVGPALAELGRRGTPYRGLLYAGLALTSDGIKVIEFNARFGDPETQVVLDRLATPLAGLLAAAADGDLPAAGQPRWSDGAAVTVVIAAEGYPGTPATGDQIDGIDEAQQIPGAYVLHAGTVISDGALVTSGGRVLDVVGTGQDLAQARAAAYTAAARIRLRGGWYRTDIAGQPGPQRPPGG